MNIRYIVSDQPLTINERQKYPDPDDQQLLDRCSFVTRSVASGGYAFAETSDAELAQQLGRSSISTGRVSPWPTPKDRKTGLRSWEVSIYWHAIRPEDPSQIPRLAGMPEAAA